MTKQQIDVLLRERETIHQMLLEMNRTPDADHSANIARLVSRRAEITRLLLNERENETG